MERVELEQIIEQARLDGVFELYLPGSEIISLPENIGSLSNLTTLYLDRKKLTSLPESIGNLSNLTTLYLNKNKLMSLPDSIGNLSNLNKLSLCDNQLKILPDSIGNLSNLTWLDLNNNLFTDLSILQTLPKLKSVYCFGVNLPIRYWTRFSNWKAEWLLGEENAELRKTLIQQVGYERICNDLNAVALDIWREYTLLKIEDVERFSCKDGEFIATDSMILLKMTCPSTAHIHILRVPPEMVSAEAAITWVNHGIHPDDFAIQT